jgi:hypothetical protein
LAKLRDRPSFFPGIAVHVVAGLWLVVVGSLSDTRGEVFAGHAAADDARKFEGDLVDLV